MNKITDKVGKPLYYILNRTDEETEGFILDSIARDKVVAAIPADERIARNGLLGKPLDFELEGINKLAEFLTKMKEQRMG